MPFTTVDGTRLHYVEEGSGDPPVLLLHAFPLHSGMWEAQVAALRARRRVVSPDLKGFGRSDAPDDRDAYTMAAYADEVAALASTLGIDRAVVVGLSMGGYVAFSLLRRHRELVAGLVLADTRAASDTPEVAERRTAQQRQVAEEGTAGVIEALLQTLLSEPTREGRPDVVEETRRLMDNPPAGFVGALEAMKGRPDATADLPGIEVPTLVVVGEHDVPSPPDVARAMVERLPDPRLEVIGAAGHLSNLEQPEAFNRALVAFLDELAVRT